MSIKAVLLDIEGTTTPVTFVTQTLFPYIRRELKNYLITNWDSAEVREDVDLIIQQFKKDKEDNYDVPEILINADKSEFIDSIVKNLESQMDRDRKITSLKQLQGHMWRHGYQTGELLGYVYPDVVPAIQRWKSLSIPINIYSSGSVEAQKLLFGYTQEGSLLNYFNAHFDTKIGLKVESTSYLRIADALNLQPAEILFVTDSFLEMEASSKAGITVRGSIREGNAPLPDSHPYITIHSFDELFNESLTYHH